MPETPHVQPLSQNHRRFLFIASVVLFVCVVPILVLYAIGYRVDLSGETRNIKTVGGMYISADASESLIFVDEEPVEDMRLFRHAAYIQNLDAGLHEIHVQGEGVQTWVKELPVYSHFVTEAKSINLPVRPQVRLVAPYQTTSGALVVDSKATSSFSFASTTNVLFVSTSSATSTFAVNPEYTYLQSRFASTSKDLTMLRAIEAARSKPIERFSFFSASSSLLRNATTSATTTKVVNDMMLRERADEVEAVWLGKEEKTPYYFCLTYSGIKATALAYGRHVFDDVVAESASTTNWTSRSLRGQYLCRNSIQIDRKWQSVQYFDFVPGNPDAVVLQLQDGVYVAEIDDRSWQNVQLLYPGDYLEVIVDSGSIFVKDDEYLLEVFTELQN